MTTIHRWQDIDAVTDGANTANNTSYGASRQGEMSEGFTLSEMGKVHLNNRRLNEFNASRKQHYCVHTTGLSTSPHIMAMGLQAIDKRPFMI